MPGTLSTYYNLGERRYNKVKSINVIGAAGKLSINNQGRLGFATGNEPSSMLETFHAYTACDATVNIEPGAMLAIGGDNAGRNGVFHIEGAQVNIKSGAKLVIHGNSMLSIEIGSTLTLEPGAIIELRDNPDAGLVENGRARIKIEKGGKIVFGGDVTIIGDGCFEFDEGHIAEFPLNFTLTGSGKTYRFLELNKNAVLTKDGGIFTIQDGQVQTGCDAKLRHQNGAFARSLRVQYKPTGVCPPSTWPDMNDQIGLEVINNGFATVNHCDFIGVARGFRAESVQQSVSIQNSTFSDNYGVDILLTKNAALGNVVGTNTTLKFSNMSTGATLSNCKLTGAYFFEPIRVENVKMLYINSSNVDAASNDYCINALQGENNITLTRGTTLQNATWAGVAMNGGVQGFKFSTDYGLLRMDCARILDCTFAAVFGEDILLDIDAVNNSNGLRANEFRKGNQGAEALFFDICFKKRNVPGNIVNARGNVWNVAGGIPAPSDYFMRKTVSGGPCELGLPIMLNAGNPGEGYDPNCPIECTDCVTGGATEDRNNGCLLNGIDMKSTTNAAWRAYHEAWSAALNTESEVQLASALAFFGMLASVDSVLLSGSSPECSHMSLVSKVFVPENSSGPRYWNQDGNTEWARVYPNPSSDFLVIESAGILCNIIVLDAFGRTIYRANAQEKHFVHTAAWPSGMYRVDISTTTQKTQLKVVVQH